MKRRKEPNLELTVEDRLEVILEAVEQMKTDELKDFLRKKLGKWQSDDFMGN